MNKRILSYSLTISLLLLTFLYQAFAAEKYPSREIQMVLSSPAGGFVDIAVRFLSDSLAKELGVPIVISNKAGAAGATGTHFLVKSKPDGYTIGCISSAHFLLLPVTVPNIPYQYTDLDPLCNYASSPTIVFCKTEAPWKTLEDLVSDAKKRPGQINYGATTNSVSHLQMSGFLKAAGIEMMHVPLQDVGVTITRILGGNLDIGVSSLAPLVGQLNAGTLRGLFLTTSERMSAFPQIPTLKEKRLGEPILVLYTSFFAPLGLPKPIKETLERALEKTIKVPGVKKKLEDVSLELEYLHAEALAKQIHEDYRRLNDFIKSGGLQK